MGNIAIILDKSIVRTGHLGYHFKMKTQGMTLFQRKLDIFYKNIDFSLPKEVCWEWKNKNKLHGYGNIQIRMNGRRFRQGAHRFAYEYFFNCTIPEEKMVLHKCDNKACCNPSHLYLGDHQQNMIDAKERSRFGTHEEIGERNRRGLITREEKQGRLWNDFGEFMSLGDDPTIRKGRLVPSKERSEKIKAKVPRGGNHYKSHLNNQDILDIIELRKSGLTLSEISTIYKINVPGIHKICQGKRWAHVQREVV